MTTIAIDAVSVAADGRRTWGDQIAGDSWIKLRRQNGMILGFAGPVPLFDPVVDWFLGGADPGSVPKYDNAEWSLIIVDGHPDGVARIIPACPFIERFSAPVAFGAGADYAIGAMLAGASAKRAIEIVASICTHTGGEILEYPVERLMFSEAKARPTKVRSEFVGFRTTPEVKSMIEALRSMRGAKVTVTDVMESTITAIADLEGVGGDGSGENGSRVT